MTTILHTLSLEYSKIQKALEAEKKMVVVYSVLLYTFHSLNSEKF